ncbi:mitofusin-2-like [Amphiura filiformis]|uniref:mitofusin-2-like n=1 Tax=Amphiura filiformis TaxID=82378 RepID=UPI003B20D2A4
MDMVHRFIRGATPAGRFVNARTNICKNFQDLIEQVIQPCCEVSENTTSLPRETVHDDELKAFQMQLNECRQKTLAIMPILQRDKMKAVVFGCTSSGKSTLINAMLDDDVLPTSMGVCSSCLVQIEGCDGEDSFLTLPDGTQRSVQDLEELGSELEDIHLGAGETAIVYWPKSKCELLSNDIQIVDRPGISSNPEVDKIVNDKCSDADVHIFVVDSVASITTESREYFMSVAKKLSKPNIFFVYNKWDESAYTKKPERNQKVRQQHVKAAKDLLREGLNAEVEEEFDTKKIFFVSAREIIWGSVYRFKINKKFNLKHQGNQVEAKTHAARLLDDHQLRKAEFNRFLEELQKSISACAIKTKFGPHCNEGIALCDRLDAIAQGILDSLDHAMNELVERNGALIEENEQLKSKQVNFGMACEDMTEEAKTKLERRVRQKKDELRGILDQTLAEIPFEEDGIDMYKETILDRFRANDDELHGNIEEAVTDDLADIRREMEDLADIGDAINFTRTPHTTGTRFRLRKPPTSLSDAAAKDLHIDPPSYTDNMAWFRRGMSSFKAKMTTLAGSALGAGAGVAAGSTGVGTGILLIGGGAIGIAKYLESNREARKRQILETIMRNYKTWLDDQEHIAQVTCLTTAGQLANNIKETFNEKINGKVDANRNLISSLEVCIQQLRVASECLKIYKKSQLQTVKKSFEQFHWNYLQDRPEDVDSENESMYDDWQFY